jgi:single-stranded-DNA-specific exonuclease
MLNREVGDMNKFIAPSRNDLHDPFLFEDMGKAVDRIISAINNNEKITIMGDYDVDGVTAITIILTYLREAEYDNISYYVPDRIEGYGMNKPAIKKIAEEGTKLIITVDCGITCISEVEYAKELGMDVIVTDHHEQCEEIPNALAVIDPKMVETKYPFSGLCGAGVAYKLMVALHSKLEDRPLYSEYLEEFFDLVAFATIADIVPLIDENRFMVQKGLRYFNATCDTKRPTFEKIIEVAGFADKVVTAESIGYYLAPRVNAIGRLESAVLAVEYFNNTPLEELGDKVLQINKKNDERKVIENRMVETVISGLPRVEDFKDSTIVVAHPSFTVAYTGIKGLVASKIVNIYHRPTIVFNENGDFLEGSCRSIEGFDMKKALDHCSDICVKYGGHTAAAGLTIKKEDFEAFKTKFENYARKILTEKDFVPCFYYDCEVNTNDLTTQLMRDMDLFAPYGEQNPSPKFVIRNATVIEKRTMGKNNDHLRLKISQNGISFVVLGFFMAHMADSIEIMSKVDILFQPQENSYQGITTIQINAEDIRLSDEVVDNTLTETLTDILSLEKCNVRIDEELLLYKDSSTSSVLVAKQNGEEITYISPKLSAKLIYNFDHYKMMYKTTVTSIEYMDNAYKVVVQLSPVALTN